VSGAAAAEAVQEGRTETGPVRRQRVRVPMRLVRSPFYADVALSVYVKVKALASRPEGCTAGTAVIASYLGLSTASVERGITLLRQAAPDGVVELPQNTRRTLRGGRGTSALRRVRPITPKEAFVWLPVAAAEDLTPRQLRAFALIAFAEQMGIALTEGELAGSLFHYSGKSAGKCLTVTAAGVVVDELEAARWVTVQRRAGERGRHRFIAHDIAPGHATLALERTAEAVEESAAQAAEDLVQEGPDGPADNVLEAAGSSPVGEGSGSPFGEGSLATKESPMTDRPDDARLPASPAVGDVQVVGAGTVENPDRAQAGSNGSGGGALRADGTTRPAPSNRHDEKRSSGGRRSLPSRTGRPVTLSAQAHSVLEPVHWLLEQVGNPFVVRQIGREVDRQLADETAAERLTARLQTRFARADIGEIRDAGRWLLGVGLPRWGCGHADCEAGTMWSTGRRCDVCAEVVADRAAARRREQWRQEGLCPEHGLRAGAAGCPQCELERAVRDDTAVPAAREPQGPPRGACGECGCRIVLVGQALTDGLCKPCRREAAAGPGTETTAAAMAVEPEMCAGWDGVACGRPALPTRTVCARHRASELVADRDCHRRSPRSPHSDGDAGLLRRRHSSPPAR
jgi:hypothetical protein